MSHRPVRSGLSKTVTIRTSVRDLVKTCPMSSSPKFWHLEVGGRYLEKPIFDPVSADGWSSSGLRPQASVYRVRATRPQRIGRPFPGPGLPPRVALPQTPDVMRGSLPRGSSRAKEGFQAGPGAEIRNTLEAHSSERSRQVPEATLCWGASFPGPGTAGAGGDPVSCCTGSADLHRQEQIPAQ